MPPRPNSTSPWAPLLSDPLPCPCGALEFFGGEGEGGRACPKQDLHHVHMVAHRCSVERGRTSAGFGRLCPLQKSHAGVGKSSRPMRVAFPHQLSGLDRCEKNVQKTWPRCLN